MTWPGGENVAFGQESPAQVDHRRRRREAPCTDPIVCQDFPPAVQRADDAAGDPAAARRVAPTVGYNVNAHQYTAACVGWPGPARGSGTLGDDALPGGTEGVTSTRPRAE